MTNDRRFVALKGAQRDWVNLDDFDWDSDEEVDSEPLPEWSPELEHDGWSAIVPRESPLAHLGDKLDFARLSGRL
ncbi:MAG: hypothetical protein AB8H86_23925 [Polyangiales bacterium]